MFERHCEMNDQTVSVIEEIGRSIQGGFHLNRAGDAAALFCAGGSVTAVFVVFAALTGTAETGGRERLQYRQMTSGGAA